MEKIALEEHFMLDEMIPYFVEVYQNVDKRMGDEWLRFLLSFDQKRLAQMDVAGVKRSVLSLSGPGVQHEPDAQKATRLARFCNDRLAEEITKRPDRYSGFAHLAMQDPETATKELVRCVKELGFVGAMINGQTGGVYLDDPRYENFWATVSQLRTVIYLHPGNPTMMPEVFKGRQALYGPMWGWTTETSTHALRLVVAGVFERHPHAKLILGHMGECLPFHLWRFDSRYAVANQGEHPLPQPPSFYIKRNIVVTTSGVCDDDAAKCSLATMGEDNVLFSIDYPFEDSKITGDWADALILEKPLKQKLLYANAEKILNIKI